MTTGTLSNAVAVPSAGGGGRVVESDGDGGGGVGLDDRLSTSIGVSSA